MALQPAVLVCYALPFCGVFKHETTLHLLCVPHTSRLKIDVIEEHKFRQRTNGILLIDKAI